MLSALKNEGVRQDYIYLIKEMYNNLKARIKTDVQSNYFNIKKGIRQDDPLSPILFISLLEQIFRNLNWENRGISINGQRITNLRFVDDTVIFYESLEELGEMMIELSAQSARARLTVNTQKTKILTKKKQNKGK